MLYHFVIWRGEPEVLSEVKPQVIPFHFVILSGGVAAFATPESKDLLFAPRHEMQRREQPSAVPTGTRIFTNVDPRLKRGAITCRVYDAFACTGRDAVTRPALHFFRLHQKDTSVPAHR
jgi:hypothetical protein